LKWKPRIYLDRFIGGKRLLRWWMLIDEFGYLS
jgi:hypothetical protein